MVKKMLVTGLVIASMATVAACSNKETAQTADTTAAVESSVEDTTKANEDAEESKEETEDTSKTEETTKELTKEEAEKAEVIRSFAEEVQITVGEKDMDALADLSEFPLTVKLADGTEQKIQDKDEFLALGEEAIFSEELMDAIAVIVPEEVEESEDGMQMGEIPGIVFDYVEGAPAITGIYLSE